MSKIKSKRRSIGGSPVGLGKINVKIPGVLSVGIIGLLGMLIGVPKVRENPNEASPVGGGG